MFFSRAIVVGVDAGRVVVVRCSPEESNEDILNKPLVVGSGLSEKPFEPGDDFTLDLASASEDDDGEFGSPISDPATVVRYTYLRAVFVRGIYEKRAAQAENERLKYTADAVTARRAAAAYFGVTDSVQAAQYIVPDEIRRRRKSNESE